LENIQTILSPSPLQYLEMYCGHSLDKILATCLSRASKAEKYILNIF
jgi:hypothetical protein